ncbi:MAG: tyrosine--tRNA ligase [Candidatus Pacebacteria bacterium]|nr:tyrosine--tRNA ligase [Candidatus Paceibacterota bacterium]
MNNLDKEKKAEEIVQRGIISQILPDKKDFKNKLVKDKLRFYIGADPTSTALHLSHAKNYMLLEEFRQLGHEVIVLIGDFTARIGDPTDKGSARVQLSKEDVEKNVVDWVKQIKPLLNFDDKDNPAKIMYNSAWLSKLTMEDVVELASNTTVQQMLERDMFEKRMKENKPIFLHEFMYPLMQGYDSVAMDVDVELCGTDQIFNALMGRTLLKKLKNKDKFVVAVNLMENPVTGELMSKSRGTGIFLNFSAKEMYGAIMSQSDEMIKVFLINNTRVPLQEIEEIMKAENPRDAKMRTAFEVVKVFRGDKEAKEAQDDFIAKFQTKEVPDNLEEINLGKDEAELFEILKAGLSNLSNSDIRRLVDQGAIKIDGEEKKDIKEVIDISSGVVVKAGKKNWFKTVG